MSNQSYQSRLLAPSLALLRVASADADGHPDAGLDVIEAAASRLGGFDLDGYREPTEAVMETGLALAWADKVLAAVATTAVPARLALAGLAQPQIDRSKTRTTGAFYTDFRLARYLAQRLTAMAGPPLTPSSSIIDTAAGTGILLAALVTEICGDDRRAVAELIGEGTFAADVDPAALRGTAAVLASFTDDLAAIDRMKKRLVAGDSLLASDARWARLGPSGFDAVVGNPPWERLRTTRHEALQAAGVDRHYGDDYDPSHQHLGKDASIRAYTERIAALYPLAGSREIDLYQPFAELALRLAAGRGRIGLLVPAGLIRSKGTEALRGHLLDRVPAVEITVLHNRARFFGIDTRVKFIAVTASTAQGGRSPLHLRHAGADDLAVAVTASTSISRTALAAVRPDRSVPEVRGDAEWKLFQHMSATGCTPDDDGPWAMQIVREVDMTNDRRLFTKQPTQDAVPVVEGRMVQAHRSRSKAYVSGTGRAAQWEVLPLHRAKTTRSQFHVPLARLAESRRRRAATARVGFCDIVGQTNERTLQAALIPPGQICGNKVPTIDLLSDTDDLDRPFVLVAVLNSLPVDWLLRRVVTTSLNYFVLRGLTLPRVAPGSPTAAKLARLARILHDAEGDAHADMRQVAACRAMIDVLVLDAYSLGADDMRLMLKDFPLLDRGQPALPGETRSTVTRDLLQSSCDPSDTESEVRHDRATGLGALAYVPEEFSNTYRNGTS